MNELINHIPSLDGRNIKMYKCKKKVARSTRNFLFFVFLNIYFRDIFVIDKV